MDHGLEIVRFEVPLNPSMNRVQDDDIRAARPRTLLATLQYLNSKMPRALYKADEIRLKVLDIASSCLQDASSSASAFSAAPPGLLSSPISRANLVFVVRALVLPITTLLHFKFGDASDFSSPSGESWPFVPEKCVSGALSCELNEATRSNDYARSLSSQLYGHSSAVVAEKLFFSRPRLCLG